MTNSVVYKRLVQIKVLIMEFNLLFSVVGALSFVIEFGILPDARQDFLFFNGDNTSAHLFRENNTVFLHLADTHFELYQTDIENQLEFSWNGFKVNGTEMKKVKTNGNVTKFDFDVFTFLSPIMENKPREEAIIETLLTSEKVNYYYILAIVFLSVLLVDSKPRTFRLIQDLLCQKKKESEYEVMNNDLMKKNNELMRKRLESTV